MPVPNSSSALGWGLLIGSLVTLGAPCLAKASDRAAVFRLSWEAPAECADAESVYMDVLELVGEAQMGRALRASGVVTRAAEGAWRLRLRAESEGASGERILEGGSCEAVTKAATVTLALMLNPDANSMVEESAPVTAEQPKERRLKVGLEIDGFAGLVHGPLPEAAPELGAGLGVRVDAALLGLALAHGFPQSVQIPSDPEAGGRLQLGSLRGVACWALLQGSAELAPCAVLQAFRVSGRGRGVTQPREGAISWAAAGAGVAVSVPALHPLRLRLALEGAVPLARPMIFLDDLGELHRPAKVSGRILGGVVMTLF